MMITSLCYESIDELYSRASEMVHGIKSMLDGYKSKRSQTSPSNTGS
ncbi:MAG: hypothetical protein QW416_08875 [Candidatus Nitrosocaldaceae archaeon]